MSKSLGNSLLVDQVVTRVRPVELRYYLVSAHYRSMLEYSDESVKEAGASYRRIEGFLERAAEAAGRDAITIGTRPAAFDEAMDDDFAVPQALAILHETVRTGNSALAAGDAATAAECASATRGMLSVLGLDPWSDPWASANRNDDSAAVIDALVQVAIQQRQEARARKDFAAADAIRDGLAEIGIVLEDTPSGARWSMKERHGR
jgi:cysteinyl-tRNA synthetase